MFAMWLWLRKAKRMEENCVNNSQLSFLEGELQIMEKSLKLDATEARGMLLGAASVGPQPLALSLMQLKHEVSFWVQPM